MKVFIEATFVVLLAIGFWLFAVLSVAAIYAVLIGGAICRAVPRLDLRRGGEHEA